MPLLLAAELPPPDGAPSTTAITRPSCSSGPQGYEAVRGGRRRRRRRGRSSSSSRRMGVVGLTEYYWYLVIVLGDEG